MNADIQTIKVLIAPGGEDGIAPGDQLELAFALQVSGSALLVAVGDQLGVALGVESAAGVDGHAIAAVADDGQAKMLDCLARLGRDVQIVVGPVRRSASVGHVAVVFAASNLWQPTLPTTNGTSYRPRNLTQRRCYSRLMLWTSYVVT